MSTRSTLECSGEGPQAPSWFCYAVGAVGLGCLLMTWSTGFERGSAILHGRPAFFDFDIYHDQARALAAGSGKLVERWMYSPFALLLVWPLSQVSRTTGHTLWLVVEAALLGWLIVLAARLLAKVPILPRFAAAFGFTVASFPLMHCLTAGQISLVLLALSLAGLRCSAAFGPASLAAATATKLYPAFYTLGFLLRRRTTYLVRFVLWLGVLGILIPWLLLPETMFEAGWNRLLTVVAQRERPLFDEAQSAQALVGRLFQSRSIFDSTPSPLLFELPLAIVVALRLLAVCAIVGITAWRLRDVAPEEPRSIALVLTACALVLDPGWSHYFVVLCYAHPVLLATARRRAAPLVLCTLSFALSSLSLVAALLWPSSVDAIYQFGTITVSALFTLCGLSLSDPGTTLRLSRSSTAPDSTPST